jgi:hypothetical protein
VLDLPLTDDEPEHQRAAGVVAYELGHRRRSGFRGAPSFSRPGLRKV